jgi:hypothetical protein
MAHAAITLNRAALRHTLPIWSVLEFLADLRFRRPQVY